VLKTCEDQSVVATLPMAAGMVIVPKLTGVEESCPSTSAFGS
jgi:hypothetical protein